MVSEGNPEWEPCEEYGHIYKTVYVPKDGKVSEVWRCCDDCGDEYEVTEAFM
jgi:hypothetical protein